jgi:hypothetical protein
MSEEGLITTFNLAPLGFTTSQTETAPLVMIMNREPGLLQVTSKLLYLAFLLKDNAENLSKCQLTLVLFWFQDIDLKDHIFIPELYFYNLLKYESPEVLKKSESLTMSASSNIRSQS